MHDDHMPDDLIRLGEASKLLPGRTPGEKLSTRSIRRWCAKWKLRWWKINGQYMVSRCELLAMVVPGSPPPAPQPATSHGYEAAMRELQRLGLA